MEILPLKLFLAPLLVVGATLAGRRWGPRLAGILVALPIVAGPILFISYAQHGAAFAAAAADSSLLGLVSLAVFALVFAHAAARFGWFGTCVISWIAVLAVDFALSAMPVTPQVAVALTLATTAVVMALMPRVATGRVTREQPSWPRWELPGRAVTTAALVVAVTTASGALGPHWTGLLAPFPVATSVVAGFVHAQRGRDATARTLAGTVLGLFGFAAFCLSVTLLVPPLGGIAFLLAAAATVVVQAIVARASVNMNRRV